MNIFKFYKSNRNQLSNPIGEGIVENGELIKTNVFNNSDTEIIKEGIKLINNDLVCYIYIKGNYYWIIKDVDKEEILSRIESQESTKDRNLMGCSENWYNNNLYCNYL